MQPNYWYHLTKTKKRSHRKMTDKEKLVLRKNYAFLLQKLDPASVRLLLKVEGLLTDYEVQAQSVAPVANKLKVLGINRWISEQSH